MNAQNAAEMALYRELFSELQTGRGEIKMIEQYNAPEYERIQMLHKLSGLYSEAYENTALFFGEELKA